MALIWTLLLCVGLAQAQYFGTYYCSGGRDVFTHLFEWKWTDIANECENFLAGAGYCAVQVSPANEHRIVTNPAYPWYQRYQPVSYKMGSRSGTEAEFINMVQRCNNAGVYIYVDAVINHMTGGGFGTGSDGSSWSGDDLDYPAVPYGSNDFHGSDVCFTHDMEIHDYNNADEVRYCRLQGLRDLRQTYPWVIDKTREFMNKLIGWGVAGFRIDASKHMFPEHMENIFSGLDDLNTQWFPSGRKPFIFQEVIDMGGSEPIKGEHYTHIGRVTEFRYGKDLGDVIRKNFGQRLANLRNFGEDWGMLNAVDAVPFIDNHDNQRGHGAGGFGSILTFFEANEYKIANAFQLAWQYGYVRVMSSYYWTRIIVDGRDQNHWVGPPSTGAGNTKDVECFNGEWVCEHKWRQISNMVKFHNVAVGQPVSNWWDNDFHAISFSRGDRAFIAINNEDFDVTREFDVGVPDGEYCDVISCDNNRVPCGNSGGGCRSTITVSGGRAQITVPSGDDPMIAIHV